MGIGKDFIENTKYKNMGETDQEQGKPYPPIEKFYSNEGIINLDKPDSENVDKLNILELINERKSVRRYENKGITQEDLSYFLWCTQGVKKVLKGKATLRTVPSAGARHAFETYLLINNVKGIKPGVYRYIATKHAIVPHDLSEGIGERLLASCLGQGMVSTSAVTFFWAADIYRMAFRYGERTYRYIHLDAGHVCQNLYLAAESKGCGVCAIAAFDDDELNSALGLDGENELVVYVAALGMKKE